MNVLRLLCGAAWLVALVDDDYGMWRRLRFECYRCRIDYGHQAFVGVGLDPVWWTRRFRRESRISCPRRKSEGGSRLSSGPRRFASFVKRAYRRTTSRRALECTGRPWTPDALRRISLARLSSPDALGTSWNCPNSCGRRDMGTRFLGRSDPGDHKFTT